MKTKYLSNTKKFYQGLKLSIKRSLNPNINHTNRFSYHFLSLRKSKFVKNVPIYHVANLIKITFLYHSEKLFASLRDIPIDIFKMKTTVHRMYFCVHLTLRQSACMKYKSHTLKIGTCAVLLIFLYRLYLMW